MSQPVHAEDSARVGVARPGGEIEQLEAIAEQYVILRHAACSIHLAVKEPP